MQFEGATENLVRFESGDFHDEALTAIQRFVKAVIVPEVIFWNVHNNLAVGKDRHFLKTKFHDPQSKRTKRKPFNQRTG